MARTRSCHELILDHQGISRVSHYEVRVFFRMLVRMRRAAIGISDLRCPRIIATIWQ